MSNGVEAEIVEVYKQHVEGIYGFCLCRLYARDLAEEATSEVFFKLVEQYPALKKAGLRKKKAETYIRNWLYGSARNAVARQLRHAKQQKQTVKDLAYVFLKDHFAGEAAGAKRHQTSIEFEDIHKAIGKLRTQDQEILVQRYLQGVPTSDIAAQMGMEHGAVRVRLLRAIRRLRKMLRTNHG